MSKRGPNANKAPAQKRVKRLNVKSALKDGNLLTGVTLAGLQVTLHVAAAYNQTSDYKSINRALYKLYQISPAFRAAFERPNAGLSVLALQLKEGHRYADGEAILAALTGFAKGKIDESLSKNVSSETVDMAKQMPTAEKEIPRISDALLIAAFSQQTSNPLMNSSACDLLALLGERLSDSQQSYSKVTSSSMTLPIEEAPPLFLPLGDVDLETKRVAQTVQEILGEDNDHDYDIENDMRNYFVGKKRD